jgi:hypothetical protein
MTIAQLVLERDDSRCFRCGLIVAASPRNCHHRLFAGRGGPDEAPNRLTLCGSGNNLRDADGRIWCHGWVHQNNTEAEYHGWVISQYDERPPELVPVLHWMWGWVLLDADYGFTITEREGRCHG